MKSKLWKCPFCGHRFVTRNLWHSCSRHRITEHFNGKDRIVRDLFRQLRNTIRTFGPVTVYAQKTRIVFQVEVRFVSVQVRQHCLDVGLWLTKQRPHPNLRKIETLMPHAHIHHFRLNHASQIDAKFIALLRESYLVGCSRSRLTQ
jgi:hypothetical protein